MRRPSVDGEALSGSPVGTLCSNHGCSATARAAWQMQQAATQRFLLIVLSSRKWNCTDHRQFSRRRGVVGRDAPSLPKLFTQRIAVATFSPFLGTAWQLSVPGDLPR